MRKAQFVLLVVGYLSILKAQEVPAWHVKLDSSAATPNSTSGFGFVYSDGVKGLFHRTFVYIDTLIGTNSIGSLKNNIAWSSSSIPGLNLNSLSSESGLTLANGSFWYNSSGSGAVRARINGETRTMLKNGDGIGASFQANELIVGVTASDSITGLAKVNNALGLVTNSSGTPAWFGPSNAIILYEDWPTQNTAGVNNWTALSSGTGSVAMTTANSDTNHIGILRLTAAALQDGATIHNGVQTMIFGGGIVVWEALVKINNLSTDADGFNFWAGFGDQTGSGDMDNGVYFLYDHNASTKWQRCTASGGSRLKVASESTVNTAWTKLRIVVDASAGSAEFFINETTIGSNTQYLPSMTQYSGVIFKIKKEVAQTEASRTADIDYAWYKKDFRIFR